MIQPQIDFCCFRLVAINIALTHCYKLVSFLNLISNKVEWNVICASLIASFYVNDTGDCNARVFLTFICKMNTTVSAGCPTRVTISPSNGTFGAGDNLTCRANGYDPTYSWTGTAGVNGTIVSATGDIYTLPEGPFNLTCIANVSQLPAPCHASAAVSDNAYSKYE